MIFSSYVLQIIYGLFSDAGQQDKPVDNTGAFEKACKCQQHNQAYRT
jgi:hypothetical protein